MAFMEPRPVKPGEEKMKPVLAGQRIKARKRDVQEKFDKEGFRDEIIEGILQHDNIEDASKYLETNTEADYRRYDVQLFDILVAGGLLAPGGTIEADGAPLNPFSCFETEDDHDALTRQAEIIRSLVRRYKYLEPSAEEAFTRFSKYLNGFEEENVLKLAKTTAILLSMGLISSKPLLGMCDIESIVSTGLARTFMTTMFSAWVKVSTIGQINSALRKGGLDSQIQVFFPQNERTVQHIVDHFGAVPGLKPIVTWFLGQQTAEVKRVLGLQVTQMMKEERGQDELIEKVRGVQVDNKIPESEIIKVLWPAMMAAVEWNKKTEMMIGQALRHIQANLKLIARFTHSDRAQIELLVNIQEYAFVHQNLIKIFKRIVLLLYNAEAVGEDCILKWYETDHSSKGQSAFLAEMKEMVDWLNTAEVEDQEV